MTIKAKYTVIPQKGKAHGNTMSAYLHGGLHCSFLGQGAGVKLGLDLQPLQCMLQQIIQHTNAVLHTQKDVLC